MKVRALIRDTMWRPGSDYQPDARPALSVLMPTFRRGADGMFLRAAVSVLEQSERDLELIIVDDGSTDGTADQIDALMGADGRVSCLRHPVNIGLPAISEYEALLRARAPYLAFAFDDFVFDPDALGRLLHAAERRQAAVHGQTDYDDAHGGLGRLGEADLVPERLALDNYVGNTSVIVPRSVIDHVGFYDPHIAAVRACDWDLWRRIVREFPIYRENVFVGREFGPSRPDSLGRTYGIYPVAVQEYLSRSRNVALRPDSLADVDVWEIPAESSVCLAEHVLRMREAFRGRAWAPGGGGVSADDARALVAPRGRSVVVVSNVNASATLCFDGLSDAHQRHLVFVHPYAGELHLQHTLARCDAVIMVRHLLDPRVQLIARWAASMHVPLYYLIDDNFVLMREEDPEFAEYTRERTVSALEDFSGVLCTSAALADYFRTLPLRADVQTIGPVFDPTKLAKVRRLTAAAPGPGLRVGFVGGEFRVRSLEEDVLPALAILSSDVTIELFSRVAPPDAGRWPLEATVLPFTDSLDGFLTTWRPLGLDVLVHPRGDTANIEYKTASVLLSALYLNAVPIVAGDPAFRGLGEEHGVLRADGDRASWVAALQRVRSPQQRRELLSRLEAFCRSHFAPDRTVRALERIFAASPPVDVVTWGWRVREAGKQQEHALTLTRRESRARAAEVDRLQREASARAADLDRLEREVAARATDVDWPRREAEATVADGARLEHETRERMAGVVAQLEHEAQGREARIASLEAELATRAYAFSLRIRKVIHLLRRLAFRG